MSEAKTTDELMEDLSRRHAGRMMISGVDLPTEEEIAAEGDGFVLRAKLNGELAAITKQMCKAQAITQQELTTAVMSWFFHQHPALRVAITNRGLGDIPDVVESLVKLGTGEMLERTKTFIEYRAVNDFKGGSRGKAKRGRPAGSRDKKKRSKQPAGSTRETMENK